MTQRQVCRRRLRTLVPQIGRSRDYATAQMILDVRVRRIRELTAGPARPETGRSECRRKQSRLTAGAKTKGIVASVPDDEETQTRIRHGHRSRQLRPRPAWAHASSAARRRRRGRPASASASLDTQATRARKVTSWSLAAPPPLGLALEIRLVRPPRAVLRLCAVVDLQRQSHASCSAFLTCSIIAGVTSGAHSRPKPSRYSLRGGERSPALHAGDPLPIGGAPPADVVARPEGPAGAFGVHRPDANWRLALGSWRPGCRRRPAGRRLLAV